MGHFTGPDVTSVASRTVEPGIHAGINVKNASYTLAETLSDSTSISIANLRGGTKVVGATLTLDNNDVQTTASAGATQRLELRTGGTTHATYIGSAQVGTEVNTWSPLHGSTNYRVTSSSNVVIVFQNAGTSSGTTSTVFNLQLLYTAADDGD